MILLAAVGVWAARSQGPTFVEVTRRDLVETVDVSGQLEAISSLEYGPPMVRFLWNYKVSFIAAEGAEVMPGDPLLSFDTTELEQRLIRTQVDRDAAIKSIEKRSADLDVELREARLALSEAHATMERSVLKTEVPEGVVAEAELKTALVDLDLARSDVEYRTSMLEYLQQRAEAEVRLLEERRDRAESEVRELERYIESMTVRTAREGTVILKSRRGEKKKVGDRSWRGERFVEIPDLSKMRVLGEVEEAESGRLAVGQVADLKLDALPDRTFGAVVVRLHQTVEQKSWRDRRKVMRLELRLDESDAALIRPGMRMQGTIEVSRRTGVVAVPTSAVHQGESGPVVKVGSRFGGKERRVELGRRNGEWIEIIAGLKEGERVAAGA